MSLGEIIRVNFLFSRLLWRALVKSLRASLRVSLKNLEVLKEDVCVSGL